MGFLGLRLYLISSLIRPADWWGPLLHRPVDDYLFIVLLGWLLLSGRLNRVIQIVNRQESRLMMFYFAAQLLSLVIAGPLSNIPALFIVNLRFFCVYLFFAAVPDSADMVRKIMFFFSLLAAIVAIQCISMSVTGIGWAGQKMYWGGRVRWIGMYDGANVTCMLLAISMAFALHFVFGPARVITRILAGIIAVLIAYGIYLTNSRGGFLAFLAVVAIYLTFPRSGQRRTKPGKVIAIAVVLLALLAVGPSRMSSMNDEYHSSSGRIDAWQEGLEMVKRSPLIGIGTGQWLKYHYRLAHNTFVQIMGETGLLGLLSWISMLYIFGKGLIAAWRQAEDSTEKRIAMGLLAALGGLLAASFFLTTTQFDLYYIFLALQPRYS